VGEPVVRTVGLADQLTSEITVLLEQPEIRRALEAQQGRLVIDWANGHVTYIEPQPRYKVGAGQFKGRRLMKKQ
jgi:hypothetical protein